MKQVKRLISLCVAVCTLTGCIQPPLYLRGTAAVQVVVETRVDVDILWQIDWESKWEYKWDVAAHGPLGYTEPAGVRMHIYTLGADGAPRSHREFNFYGKTARMDIFEGVHNLLFHNNDSEALLFRYAEEGNELSDVLAYTRNISSGLKTSVPVFTPQQKALGMTKADDLAEEPVSLPPDALYSLYDRNRVITTNPEDYIYENGRYVLRIESTLRPANYIYLVQVRLLNNHGRVVGCNGGGALTGMAGGVNLMSQESYSSTVSVPMDVYYDKEADMFGAQVFTFGLPGCNAYDETSVTKAPEMNHNLVLSVFYDNGSFKNIRIDVTDQVRALPTGGVITLDLDVDDFPEGEGSSGAFSALIDGWNEESGYVTIK